MKRVPNKCNDAIRFEPLEGRQLYAAGDLDLSFGNAGKVASQALPFNLRATAVQADGRIIAVGHVQNDFAIARLNPDGKLDPTFAKRSGGVVTTDFGGNEGDGANAVAIQPDGKITVVGVRLNNPDTVFGDKDKFAVARYNRDGSPDTSFSGDGRQTVSLGDGAEALAVSVHRDGKIAIVGRKNLRSGQDSDYAIVRLRSDGIRDASFGNDGEVKVRFSFEDRSESARSVIALPDGKVLVGVHNREQFGIWRFNADGKRDATFGSGGMTFVSMAKPRLNALAIVPGTNQVVAVGDSNGLHTVVRLTAQGARDKTFGNAGLVMQRFSQSGTAFHVLPMARGRLLVSGTAAGDSNMIMFKPDGKMETSFGRGGIVIADLGGSDAIHRTALDAGGRIVAHGSNAQGKVLQARFQNIPPVVEVHGLLNNQVTEGSIQPGAILIRRDAAYPFRTRVFLDIVSPATEGADYTSPALRRLPRVSVPAGSGSSGSLVPVQFQGTRYFVDIPAGSDFTLAEIFAKSDNRAEGDEVVRWAAVADASYQIGALNAGHVTIHDAPATAAAGGKPITQARAARPARSLFSDDRIDELLMRA